ncbi:hypothetical protein GCM10023320_23740 [Pseudonocardia adelaidensis]|uniref:DDE superfamily endonuclease n=1 Tax=Pseudonocardia adelaidensis TaxID=648754 RepID=A0ABP9NGE4_9PSEU
MLPYPSGMTVSTRALGLLADALRAHRNQRATRWRKLTPGRQALLVLAYLRKGETYADNPSPLPPHALRNQRFHQLPQLVADQPLDTRSLRHRRR